MPLINSSPFYIISAPASTVRLRMEGLNNSQVFVDDYNHTFTNGGEAIISTNDYAKGTASGYFPGTSNSYIRSVSSDYAIGTTDFTAEGFVKFKGSVSSNAYSTIYSLGTTNGAINTLRFGDSGFGHRLQALVGTDPGNIISSASWTKTQFFNTWRHVAVSKVGSTVYAFIDGTLLGTTTVSPTLTSQDLCIGNYYNVGHPYHLAAPWNGLIDNFELTVGQGKYTSNFTPPTRDAVNPLMANLKAYWRADESSGTSVSDYLYTYPANIVSGVTFGTGKFGNALVGSTSARVNGTSSVSGATDVSWSFWIKGNAPPDSWNRPIIQQRGDGTLYGYEGNYIISTNNTGKILFWDYYGGTNALLYSNTSVMNNSWHHVVVTRTSNICKIYVDSALDATQNAPQTVIYNPNLYFGMLYDRKDNTYHLNATIDDIAIWQPRTLSLSEVQDIYTRGLANKSLLEAA